MLFLVNSSSKVDNPSVFIIILRVGWAIIFNVNGEMGTLHFNVFDNVRSFVVCENYNLLKDLWGDMRKLCFLNGYVK